MFEHWKKPQSLVLSKAPCSAWHVMTRCYVRDEDDIEQMDQITLFEK